MLLVAGTACARQSTPDEESGSDEATADYLATRQGAAAAAFLAAYNHDSREALREFMLETYDPEFIESLGGIESAVSQRTELFRTYGPGRLVRVDTVSSPEIYWMRVESPPGWFGLQFDVDSVSGRVDYLNVWRVRADFHRVQTRSLGELAATLEEAVERTAREDRFSGQVLLARGDSVALDLAVGSADRELQIPVTRETQFNIASVGKLFTAVSILRLVDQGLVDLDAPLSTYIPEYPARVADYVTPRQLLTHTSGVEFDDDDVYEDARAEAKNLDELLALQLDAVERLDAGVRFDTVRTHDYTNEGIDLLGVIIQRVTGEDWQDAVRRLALGPADANTIRFSFEPGPTTALGYTAIRLEGGYAPERHVNDAWSLDARPHGLQYASARELFRFLRAAIAGDLLSPKTREMALTPSVLAGELPEYRIESRYGLGFEITTSRGLTRVGHAGGMQGATARLYYYPDYDVTLAITSNFGDYGGYLIHEYAHDLLRGLER